MTGKVPGVTFRRFYRRREDMHLAIDCEDGQNNVIIVQIKGEITFENSDLFRDKLDELISQKKSRLVINLCELKYMSSAGMGVLVHGLKICRQMHGDLRIANLSSKMRQVFLITQFTHHFSVFQNLEDAINSFSQD